MLCEISNIRYTNQPAVIFLGSNTEFYNKSIDCCFFVLVQSMVSDDPKRRTKVWLYD